MTDSQKLDHLKKILGKNFATMAKESGLQPFNLYDIKNGKCGISKFVGTQLSQKYGINLDWILNGEGEIFLNSTKNDVTGSHIESTGNNNTVGGIVYTKKNDEDIERIKELTKLCEMQQAQLDMQAKELDAKSEQIKAMTQQMSDMIEMLKEKLSK